MSLLQALGRFFSFKWLIQAFKVNKAADELFTSSAEGVGMAYDIHQEQLVKEYEEFMGALTQVETAIEDKRQRLERVEKNREEAQLALEGALTAYEEAEATGDTATMEEAEADGSRFQEDVDRLLAEEEELEADIKAQEENLKGLERRLLTMQEEIQGLSSEKANAIADYISNQKLAEANKRLAGIQSRVDSGPLDAVRKRNRELAAEARVSSRVAGIDAKDRRSKYVKAGRAATSENNFRKLAAARKAQREGQTGEGAADKRDERPEI